VGTIGTIVTVSLSVYGWSPSSSWSRKIAGRRRPSPGCSYSSSCRATSCSGMLKRTKLAGITRRSSVKISPLPTAEARA
jgi:hypothetical protein